MKILYCQICGDVLGLLGQEWRKCVCGDSGGQYNADCMTATVGGKARVFGVGNPFFSELYPYTTPETRKEMRKRFYGQPDTDAWWGEYPGDVQIFRIQSPDGPRLKVKVCSLGFDEKTRKACEPGQNRVTVVDKRPFTIDGKSDLKEVTVPANVNPRQRQTLRRKK